MVSKREERIEELLKIHEELSTLESELDDLYELDDRDFDEEARIRDELRDLAYFVESQVNSETDENGKRLYTNEKQRSSEVSYRLRHDERYKELNAPRHKVPTESAKKMKQLERRIEFLTEKKTILLIAVGGPTSPEETENPTRRRPNR